MVSYLPFSLASLGGDNHGTPESARSMSRKRPAAGSPATDDTTTPSRRLVDRVVVDVGGTRFSTSTSTLTASSSYFQRLFSDRWASSDDECFLDGDPEPFAILLSYMRRGHLDLPESLAQRVLLEAEFLGVDSLLVEVKARAHRNLHSGCQDSSDADAAASFDAEHGGLRDALRSGVLPARYYAPLPEPPPPPEPKVVQLFPAPEGMRVKVWVDDDDDGTTFDVHCLALVENPKELASGVKGGSRLDAIVTHPDAFGHVLASEAFGSSTEKFELLWNAETGQKALMTVPEGMALNAEYWIDADDHSKGTDTHAVRMVRFLRNELNEAVIEPVDFAPDGRGGKAGLVKLVNASSYANFKQFNV